MGILILAGLIVTVIALGMLCAYVVRPLDQAAKLRRRPTQFTIVDFLCLFVLIQIPAALIHSTFTRREFTYHTPFLLDGYAWLSCGLIWWKCVQIMSRAGIHKPWHRIVLLIVVLPLTVISLIAAFVAAFCLLAGLCGGHLAVCATALGIAAAVTVVMVVCARLIRRIVAASEVATEVAVEIVDDSPRPTQTEPPAPPSEPPPSEPRL